MNPNFPKLNINLRELEAYLEPERVKPGIVPEHGTIEDYLAFEDERARLAQEAASALQIVGDQVRFNMTPRRWRKLRLHAEQMRLWNSTARFRVVPAGRRSGKTELAKRFIVWSAIHETRYDDAWFIAAAPTHKQAKQIYWRDLKALVPKELLACRPSESELTITLINGAQISVMGLDEPARAEGRSINGIVLDEYGNMLAKVWPEHIRPALSDRMGWAWLIGVPEGRNHYYELYLDARGDESGQWDTFAWTTEDVLPLYLGKKRADIELKAAAHDLDQLTYNQEYRADFVNFTGLAYYSFDAKVHAKDKQPYDKLADLIFAFDFNTAPGVCGIMQESPKIGTRIIDEVYIPRGSNTQIVCDKLIEKYAATHTIRNVFCYGDSTGGAGGSAKVEGSDWALVRRKLKPAFPGRVFFRVPNENPRERVRVNSMNSRLKSVDGNVRMYVDPKCKYTIRDYEGVRLLEGGSGEIDKDSDKKLTHLSDGIGYYVTSKFPVGAGSMLVSEEV